MNWRSWVFRADHCSFFQFKIFFALNHISFHSHNHLGLGNTGASCLILERKNLKSYVSCNIQFRRTLSGYLRNKFFLPNSHNFHLNRTGFLFQHIYYQIYIFLKYNPLGQSTTFQQTQEKKTKLGACHSSFFLNGNLILGFSWIIFCSTFLCSFYSLNHKSWK